MTVQRQIDQLIAHRASEWIEILKTAGPEERAAFVDWLRESRRHVAEFLSMVALDRELGRMDLREGMDLRALLERVSSQVTPLHAASAPQPDSAPARGTRATRRRWLVLLAACLGAAVVGLTWTIRNATINEDFITAAAAEQRAIELPDGSVMQMNAHTHVQMRMSGTEREMRLLSGEALFKVTRDAKRPFRVRTRDALIEVLGTQFNVDARGGGTKVSVIEGKVQVAPRRPEGEDGSGAAGTPTKRSTQQDSGREPAGFTFSAGEQGVIDPTGQIRKVDDARVAEAVAWRRHRLVFKRAAIEEVASEFNRYNASPKLRLQGIAAGSRHYSATFNMDDPESFGDFLAHEEDVTVERRAGEIVIRPRN